MKVLHVTPEKIEQAWPHAAPWIEKANKRGGSTYPLHDMLMSLHRGTKTLFKLIHGKDFVWVILGVVENSENRTCFVHSIAGEGLKNFMGEVVEFCEMYAMYNQCDYISGNGRAAWTKELKKYGWGEISRTVGRRLT